MKIKDDKEDIRMQEKSLSAPTKQIEKIETTEGRENKMGSKTVKPTKMW